MIDQNRDKSSVASCRNHILREFRFYIKSVSILAFQKNPCVCVYYLKSPEHKNVFRDPRRTTTLISVWTMETDCISELSKSNALKISELSNQETSQNHVVHCCRLFKPAFFSRKRENCHTLKVKTKK